ncbi:hypothetical protein ACRVX5_00975 [Clostridioides difficile]
MDRDIEFVASLKRLSSLIKAKENLIEDIREYSANDEILAKYENLDKTFEKTIIDEAKFLINMG